MSSNYDEEENYDEDDGRKELKDAKNKAQDAKKEYDKAHILAYIAN